ncbi:hypothetical protein [Chryseobacterium camelliae]|uniref:hypothetical protein n=1 Tax=Chryseobacterium camelliae TaxID=1265445 RepID=UPI002858F90C|nr:hypothetical protein [Chryseobacterium camelliae]MDR6513452.1 hypothetical protein [Chryseobacterium camelliae]
MKGWKKISKPEISLPGFPAINFVKVLNFDKVCFQQNPKDSTTIAIGETYGKNQRVDINIGKT